MAVMAFATGWAQNTSDVKQLMDDGKKYGDYIYRESINMLYESITVKDERHYAKVKSAVMADAKRAVDKEEAHVGNKLFYAEYTLPQKKGRRKNCFVFYKDMHLQKNNPRDEIVVIYIETWSTLSEIKKNYRK